MRINILLFVFSIIIIFTFCFCTSITDYLKINDIVKIEVYTYPKKQMIRSVSPDTERDRFNNIIKSLKEGGSGKNTKFLSYVIHFYMKDGTLKIGYYSEDGNHLHIGGETFYPGKDFYDNIKEENKKEVKDSTTNQ